MLDAILEALLDTAKALPFLFAAYLIIGFIETRTTTQMQSRLSRLGPLGPIGGAVLGAIPQCGFSVAAADFYANRIVSMGTVVAVFLSTSDEAIPILVAHPERFPYLWKMILLKLGIAIVSGVGVDLFGKLFRSRKGAVENQIPVCEDPACDGSCGKPSCCDDNGCGCGARHGNFFLSAIFRTIQTGLFIVVINIILGLAIFWIGEETIGSVLLNGTVFQPLIAALIGFIPNCAASVILTELFAEGVISFGSCIAGLCTGAGVGLAVLFRKNRNWKQNLTILAILYGVAVVSGLLIDLLFA